MIRVIQSTWFPNPTHLAGRWANDRIMLFNLALSFHFLRKFYDHIVLHTDQIGYKILIGDLNLPYDEVVVSLEKEKLPVDEQHLFDRYWILRKLYTYSQQHDPFIHIDNDVYLFKKLDDRITSADLCGQNLESNYEHYARSLEIIRKKFEYIPSFLVESGNERNIAINVGIVGGRNHFFFKEFYCEIIAFLKRNEHCLHHIHPDVLNVFLEQFAMHAYASHRKAQFECLLTEKMADNFGYDLYSLHDPPASSNYVHIMNFKSNSTACELIAKTLFLENRELYDRCQNVYDHLFANKEKQILTPFCRDTDRGIGLESFFYRTCIIAEAISKNLKISFASIGNILESFERISKILNPDTFSVLLDAFNYELIRYEFSRRLSCNFRKLLYQNLEDNKLKMDEHCFGSQVLSISDKSVLVNSKWHWVAKNEFARSVIMPYENNLRAQPGYFESLIVYYPEQEALKEQELNNTDRLIFEYAAQNMPVSRVINLIITNKAFIADNILPDRSLIESRIRFFIYQCALSLH